MTLEDKMLNLSYGLQTVQELRAIKKVEKFKTGISQIDNTFGFPCGLYFITAVAGTGKTFFATWLAKQMFELNDRKTFYMSLEMSEPIIRRRILQQWSNLTPEEFNKGFSVRKAIELMQDDAILVKKIDRKHQSTAYMEKVVGAAANIGIDIFIFDHINELAGMNDDRNMKTADEWASFFVDMANKFPHMHFIVFCQPNKQSFKQKVLTLDSIKGSSVIAEKAHYFLSLNRLVPKDEFEESNQIEEDRRIIIRLDKTRNTAINHINYLVHFDETGNFVERSK